MASVPFALYCGFLLYFSHHLISSETSRDDNFILSCLLSKSMVCLYCVPLIAIILSLVTTTRVKLSKIYDRYGDAVTQSSSNLPPFLPDEDYVSKDQFDAVRMKLQAQHENGKEETKNSSKHDEHTVMGWALVTGASAGIGRAVAISLARRNIPVVLVARDVGRLERLSSTIKHCYGVQTFVIQSDLCNGDAVTKISNTLERNNIHIDILVNNAGVGDTREVVAMSASVIDELCQLNIVNTTKLTQLLGAKMKKRRSGRIAFMSSLTGAMPGVPNSAVYAATKCYQRSLSASLGREMEHYGVGVTCIMPGAVMQTDFASSAKMANALIWKIPAGRLTPEIVAESTVKAIIQGRQEVVVGWLNWILVYIVGSIAPPRLVLLICEFSWKPPPFLTKTKKENKGEIQELL